MISINEKVLLFKASLFTLIFNVPYVYPLLNTQYMIKPTIDNFHQWLFIDIAEEDRVDNFYHFLVHNSVSQFQTVLIHHLQNSNLACVVLDCDCNLT